MTLRPRSTNARRWSGSWQTFPICTTGASRTLAGPLRGASHARNSRRVRMVRTTNILTAGNLSPREPVAPGDEVLREDPSRPQLFRIWLKRNCRYVNNYNPILLLALLANVDIQGCASKYGVVSYVTPYITHRGSKGGSPFAQAVKYDRPVYSANGRCEEKLATGHLSIF